MLSWWKEKRTVEGELTKQPGPRKESELLLFQQIPSPVVKFNHLKLTCLLYLDCSFLSPKPPVSDVSRANPKNETLLGTVVLLNLLSEFLITPSWLTFSFYSSSKERIFPLLKKGRERGRYRHGRSRRTICTKATVIRPAKVRSDDATG